jgi:hypothetical protein
VLRVVDPKNTTQLKNLRGMGARGTHDPHARVFHAALSRARRGIRREPYPQFPWDGVAEVRPFGAMEKTIVEGVY